MMDPNQPDPNQEDDLIPLAPLNEEQEAQRQQLEQQLRELGADLIAETGGPPPIPLEHREHLSPEDLEHFVVNYCLDAVQGRRERLILHAARLVQFEHLGLEAIRRFQQGLVEEPALREIPAPTLRALLKDLEKKVRILLA